MNLGLDTGVIRISINTLEDFMNGDFAELAHFGKIPTEEQRRRWLEEERRHERRSGSVSRDSQKEI